MNLKLPGHVRLPLATLLAGAAVGLVLWIGLAREQTYASNQDPSVIYLPLARAIADSGFAPAEIRRTAEWMAPGWPLLLALCMKVGGPFAPAWIQLPFALLFLAALWRLVARHTGEQAVAGFAVWATVLAWVAGPGSTFAFLFHPFREMPALAAGLWAVERAGAAGHPRAAGGAALGILLVAMIRESFVPATLAACLAEAWFRRAPEENRRRRLAWILGPLLAVALAKVACFPGANRQVESVWLGLRRGLLFSPSTPSLLKLLSWVGLYVSLPGLVLALAAPLFPARRRAAVVLGIFALCTCAVHLFLPVHTRYVLSCSALVPALAALSLTALLARLPKPCMTLMHGTMIAACFGFAATRAPSFPQVSRADIKETLRRVASALPPGGSFFVEPGSRTIVATLLGFSSSWHQGRPATTEEGGLYFEPVQAVREDRGAVRAPLVPPVGAALRGLGWNLLPLRDRSGVSVPLALAGNTYHLRRVSRYKQTRTEQVLPTRTNAVSTVLWINLLGMPPVEAHLRVMDTRRAILTEWVVRGGALHGLLIRDPAVLLSMNRLVLAAEVPVPAHFLQVTKPADQALALPTWFRTLAGASRPIRGPQGWLQTQGWDVERWAIQPPARWPAGPVGHLLEADGRQRPLAAREPVDISSASSASLELLPGVAFALTVQPGNGHP